MIDFCCYHTARSSLDTSSLQQGNTELTKKLFVPVNVLEEQ